LHGGRVHVLINGYALFLLGTSLERWLGHARFLALWVLGALSGSVLSLLVVPLQPSVGASGAIFALFGAVFVIGRRLGLDTRMITILLAVNLGITFLVPGISWTAALGGLVAGQAFWVLGALSGSVLSLLVVPLQPSVGASGAIFALFGAVFVIGRRLGLDTRMITILLAVNLGITFLVPGISWTAHIGGLVAGLAIG